MGRCTYEEEEYLLWNLGSHSTLSRTKAVVSEKLTMFSVKTDITSKLMICAFWWMRCHSFLLHRIVIYSDTNKWAFALKYRRLTSTLKMSNYTTKHLNILLNSIHVGETAHYQNISRKLLTSRLPWIIYYSEWNPTLGLI